MPFLLLLLLSFFLSSFFAGNRIWQREQKSCNWHFDQNHLTILDPKKKNKELACMWAGHGILVGSFSMIPFFYAAKKKETNGELDLMKSDSSKKPSGQRCCLSKNIWSSRNAGFIKTKSASRISKLKFSETLREKYFCASLKNAAMFCTL